MLSLAFNLSPNLRISLQRIDYARKRLLLAHISPQDEHTLRWNAKLNRTYWSLKISGNKQTRFQMTRLLSRPVPKGKRLMHNEREVVSQIKAQNHIQSQWAISTNKVTVNTLLYLHMIATNAMGTEANARLFREKQIELARTLDYIEASTDHGVIKAGIAQIALRLISPFSNFNGRVTRLLSMLILYKDGLDMRRMLVPDEYWYKNMSGYKTAVTDAKVTQNLTHWLEYYTAGIAHQLERAITKSQSPQKPFGTTSAFWRLDERQREILALLENPRIRLANREIQKIFKVSQITASRDLAKLTRLGLLFRHGAGRAVYYTRV